MPSEDMETQENRVGRLVTHSTSQCSTASREHTVWTPPHNGQNCVNISTVPPSGA